MKNTLRGNQMPKIAEIKEIDGEVWVCIGKLEDHESGVALWSPTEQKLNYQSGYNDGWEANNNATKG